MASVAPRTPCVSAKLFLHYWPGFLNLLKKLSGDHCGRAESFGYALQEARNHVVEFRRRRRVHRLIQILKASAGAPWRMKLYRSLRMKRFCSGSCTSITFSA